MRGLPWWLVAWISLTVLAFLFVGVWTLWSHPDAETLLRLGGSLAFSVLFFWAISRGVRLQRDNALNLEGSSLLQQGRYAAALEKFEAFRKLHPKHVVGPFNVGIASLPLWRLEQAVSELELAAGRTNRSPMLRDAIPGLGAVAAALLGRVDVARSWLSGARPEAAKRPMAVLAQGLLDCRAGEFEAARGKLASFEVKQLGGFHRALADAASGLCAERQTGELRPVDKVALFGETGPEPLRAAWPELADFVSRAPVA